jgi:hypothetical protein
MLPNIRDDVVNALLGITQGNMSYAAYTQQFNDFLRRSRKHLTYDLQRVRFISGLADIQLHPQTKSHRSQRGYILPLVELQNFLNTIVTNSLHLGRVKSTAGPSTTHGGGQPTKKRTYEDPLVRESKLRKRDNGPGVGRCRGRGGGRGGCGQTSPNIGRLDFGTIA